MDKLTPNTIIRKEISKNYFIEMPKYAWDEIDKILEEELTRNINNI